MLHRLAQAAGLILLSSAIYAPATTVPVMAYEDDDIHCIDFQINGKSVLECNTIGHFRAECELTDPETITDHCKEVAKNRVVRFPVVAESLVGSGSGGGDPSPAPANPSSTTRR